ncbi:probable G- coupled receptor 162 [Pelobates cultripes]|uniref:Probable G- coupled receptor 162 n=1 Tax=Pelobates cultripes TaxID=61616 RepID=A0AAD1WUB4_PELCU|nr:probable G- coupled receptor 162 [Pelobates cultripes]
MPRAHEQDDADELYQNNSLSWLACGALSLLANGWSILSLASRGGSGQRPRPLELLLCLLAGTHLLMAAVPLSLFSVVQLRRRHSPGYEWNEGLCKVFVSTYYTLALSTCLTVACLSYHRMWMVRWPVSYRLGGARRQALQGALGIWAASFVLSTLPSIGWHDNARRFYTRGCHFLASRIGLGFGLCFQLLLLGGVGTGLGCLGVTLYHACCCPASGQRGASEGGPEGKLEVPAIVVQDAQGKRRSSLDGSESPRTAAQVTGLVGGIVLLYDALTGLPILVVSFVSLRYDSAPPWMVLCVLWCSMAQTLLLPSFIWSCARYRADLRTVWEHCASMLSDSGGDDDSGREDFADGRLCEVRFDSNGASLKRPPHYIGGELRDGKFLPARHVLLPTDRSQYLQVHRHQVPLSRRMSHDEIDMFPARSSPLLLRWSSSDDVRGGNGSSRGGSPSSPRRGYDVQPWSRHPPSRREGEDGLTSLQQFLAGGLGGPAGFGGGMHNSFFRDEITAFIDDTPCPSPIGTPHRVRAAPRASPLPRRGLEGGVAWGASGERRLSLCSAPHGVPESRRASLSEKGSRGRP